MCQPGRPLPQGLGQEGSPGLADFHRAKSAPGPLSLGHAAAVALRGLDAAMAQLAVIGTLGHLEIHVALRLVGETLFDERLRELDDLVDRFGASREVVDHVDAQGREVVHVVGRHFRGQLRHGNAAAVRLGDQLVVHVGDVHHQRHLVAGVGQVAFHGVEDDRADHVADVAGLVDGRAAEINAHRARLDRLEGLFRSCQGVVDAEHGGRD